MILIDRGVGEGGQAGHSLVGDPHVCVVQVELHLGGRCVVGRLQGGLVGVVGNVAAIGLLCG